MGEHGGRPVHGGCRRDLHTALRRRGVHEHRILARASPPAPDPLGPCGADTQILTTYGSVLGPGGGSLFADATGAFWVAYAAWQGGSGGCTNYSCGATRQLFVAPIRLSVQVPCSPPASQNGYRVVASDGGVFAFGTMPFCGSMGGQYLAQPVVGIASTPDGGGYWEVASDGGIFAFGDAPFYGSMGGKPLDKPVVGFAADPNGGGYWEVASDGGVFAFGNAPFYGSMGGKPLAQPIVGIAATPDGGGLLGGGLRRRHLRLRRCHVPRLDGG